MSGRKLALIIWGPIVAAGLVYGAIRLNSAIEQHDRDQANLSAEIDASTARLAAKGR